MKLNKTRFWKIFAVVFGIILFVFLIVLFISGIRADKFYKGDLRQEVKKLSYNDYQIYLELEEENIEKNTGIWTIENYVDDFGDKTEGTYITTIEPIKGTFSNTATQDSNLRVKLAIDNENLIGFQLYEYGGNNPVKSIGRTFYTMDVKDKDGITYNFNNMINRSDVIIISKILDDELGAIDLHNILLKGGEIKFIIKNEKYPTSEYKFTIPNADGYENTFREFQK